jgi:hypothetical protein
MNTNLRGVKRAAALAVLWVACGVIPANARADFRVCNDQAIDIWFSYAKSSDVCPGSFFSPLRGFYSLHSWWQVPPRSCKSIAFGFAGNRRYFTYALAGNGSREWPSSGSTSNLYPEILLGGWGLDPGTCRNVAFSRCGNGGCLDKPHRLHEVGNQADFTVRF